MQSFETVKMFSFEFDFTWIWFLDSILSRIVYRRSSSDLMISVHRFICLFLKRVALCCSSRKTLKLKSWSSFLGFDQIDSSQNANHPVNCIFRLYANLSRLHILFKCESWLAKLVESRKISIISDCPPCEAFPSYYRFWSSSCEIIAKTTR